MKRIISIILCILSFSVFASDSIKKETATKILQDIKSQKDIIFATREKDIDSAYKALDKAIPVAEQEKDIKLLEEIIRVAIYVSGLEPSHEAGVFILPLYRKYKAQMDEIIERYPERDKERILNHLKAAALEDEKGNG